MNIDKFLKSKTFTVIFIAWILAINILYYRQFKSIYKIFLAKLGVH